MLKITNNVQEFQKEDECVVYFTALWCNPCKQLKPHYGRVSVIDSDINYYLVDVDSIDQNVLKSYNVLSIPQIFVMQKGKITNTILSRTTESILEELGR